MLKYLISALLSCICFNVHSQQATAKEASQTNDTLPDSIAVKYKSTMAGKSAWHFNDYFKLKKTFTDSAKFVEQWKKFDELIVTYEAEKKDSEIKLLQHEKQLQEAMLQQATNTRNWILGVVTMLVVIVGLLIYNSRLKQRTNKQLQVQRLEIEQQNHKLLQLVDEKDWLVKEIHHRVKNNLQVVMSLLNSQAASLQDKAALSAIQESQHRIRAMALIHQKLYQSEGMARIQMQPYLQDVLVYLQDSYSLSSRVRFSVEVEEIELDVTQAVPLGLFINEALTNAFKYAFPGERSGTITLSLVRLSPATLQLSITDDGVGLPIGFDPVQSRSLGMILLHGFGGQLGGEFSLVNQNGVSVRLVFADEPFKSPVEISGQVPSKQLIS